MDSDIGILERYVKAQQDHKRSKPQADQISRVTPARVQAIFSVMSNTNRVDVLRILNSRGSLPYSELKALAGFRSKKESGKFAYHLRKLTKQSLVATSKNDKRYTITNLGKIVLDLAGQLERKAILESGRMYVRTSKPAIEEFNSDKIAQSLVREGRLPRDQAQKITEEVENRIYKYQTRYLTGSLIREMVNTVLVEEGHENYRNRMARLGIPVFDIQERLMDENVVKNGVANLLFSAGSNIFAEYMLNNAFPKNIADMHMSGAIHIANLATVSLMPDTIFADAKELLDGEAWYSKPHVWTPKRRGGSACAAVSGLLRHIMWEATDEVVIFGLAEALHEYHATATDVADILYDIQDSSRGSTLSVSVSPDSEATDVMIEGYIRYMDGLERPDAALILQRGDNMEEYADRMARISKQGGKVGIGDASQGGICKPDRLRTSFSLHSTAINLPRLAYSSNQDEKYFRAKMVMLLGSVMESAVARRRSILDITQRGLNPFLARHIMYEGSEPVEITVNMVGLWEAISDIIGVKSGGMYSTAMKVLGTATEMTQKMSEKSSVPISMGMVPSSGVGRMVNLDAAKEGRNNIPVSVKNGRYSQGITVDVQQASTIHKSDLLARHIQSASEMLNGGYYIRLEYNKSVSTSKVVEAIKRLGEICNFVVRPGI